MGDTPATETAMRAALTERLARLREAEAQAVYQMGRAAGAAAEVALILSGFDTPYPTDAPGVGTDEATPVSGAAGVASSPPAVATDDDPTGPDPARAGV